MVQLQTKQRVLLCYYLIKFSGDDSTGTSFTIKQFFLSESSVFAKNLQYRKYQLKFTR